MAGESVTYLATTAKAVKVLEKDGFDVGTVARFLSIRRAATGRAAAVWSSMNPACSATRTP